MDSRIKVGLSIWCCLLGNGACVVLQLNGLFKPFSTITASVFPFLCIYLLYSLFDQENRRLRAAQARIEGFRLNLLHAFGTADGHDPDVVGIPQCKNAATPTTTPPYVIADMQVDELGNTLFIDKDGKIVAQVDRFEC